jgi:hypothetical protein
MPNESDADRGSLSCRLIPPHQNTDKIATAMSVRQSQVSVLSADFRQFNQLIPPFILFFGEEDKRGYSLIFLIQFVKGTSESDVWGARAHLETLVLGDASAFSPTALRQL